MEITSTNEWNEAVPEWTAEIIEDPETNEYFWKRAKLAVNIDSNIARNNSKKMDNYIAMIKNNWENINDILNKLRRDINEEYKELTNSNIDLNLTGEQLLSILDAHEQDGKLWELTIWQLKQKVKVLDETITDKEIKRFLLEAGFCGKNEEIKENNETNVQRLEELWINIPETNREFFNKMELDFKKLNKLKELWININVNDIMRFNQIEFDFEKLQELKWLGVEINSKNFRYLNMLNFENTETLMKFQKLQKLWI